MANSDEDLFDAIKRMDLGSVEDALARGADHHAKDEDHATPLHRAVVQGHQKIVQALLDHGVEVDIRDVFVRTPLHWVCGGDWRVPFPMVLPGMGSGEMARMLLQNGADVDAITMDGEGPLHLVSRESRADVAEVLVDFGADATAPDRWGKTPLHRAARQGAKSIVELLISAGGEVNRKMGYHGMIPLHEAAVCGDEDVVRNLIEYGACPNAKASSGATPLHYVTSESAARLLIQSGAGINSKDKHGMTPLHWAAMNNRTGVVRALIDEEQTELDARDKRGLTPLHCCVRRRHATVAKILLEHGADVDIQGEKGETPLDVAGRSGGEKVLNLLASESDDGGSAARDDGGTVHGKVSRVIGSPGDVKKRLAIAREGVLPQGSFVVRRSKSEIECRGVSPFHWAARVGAANLMKELVAADIPYGIDAADEVGASPLHYAAGQNQTEVAEVLLEAGAKPDSRDIEGATPLHWAAMKGCIKALRVLLAYGARSDVTDQNGNIPLDVATEEAAGVLHGEKPRRCQNND